MPPRMAPRKNYCLTIYPDHEADPRTKWDPDRMTYLVVGNETCPETNRAHYQCYVQYIKKVRMTTVKEDFGRTVHVEASRGSDEDNYNYCTKEGDFTEFGTRNNTVGNRSDLHDAVEASKTMSFDELSVHEVHATTVARHMMYFRHVYNMKANKAGIDQLRANFADFVPRPWQQDLLTILTETPDLRKFHWYFDGMGNTGKSYFSDYLVAYQDAVVFTSGKMADITLAYKNESIVVFDLTRTQADKMDHIYALIEGFKNGRLFSPKYESVIKTFPKPHVIVFANFIPEDKFNKLSQDRWVIHEL